MKKKSSFLSALRTPAFRVNPPATPVCVRVVVAGGELLGAVVMAPLSVAQHTAVRVLFPPEFYIPLPAVAQKWGVSSVYALPGLAARWLRRAAAPEGECYLQWD